MELASAVMPFVQTDLSNTEIFMLATKAPKLMSYPIEELHLPFEGTYENKMIRGMAVLVPDMETLKSALWEFIYGIKA